MALLITMSGNLDGTWIKTSQYFSAITLVSAYGCWVVSGPTKKVAVVLDGAPLGLSRSRSNQ